MEEGRYSTYVLDTAPTGHALRLLSMPDVLESWIGALARLRYRYREVVYHMAREEADCPQDDFLFTMKRTIKRMKALLKDPRRSRFVLVTTPEALAVEESARLLEHLKRFGIPVRSVVVNGLLPEEGEICRFCKVKRREQERYWNELEKRFQKEHLIRVAREPDDIRGVDKLRRLGAEILPHLDLPSGPGKRGARSISLAASPYIASCREP